MDTNVQRIKHIGGSGSGVGTRAIKLSRVVDSAVFIWIIGWCGVAGYWPRAIDGCTADRPSRPQTPRALAPGPLIVLIPLYTRCESTKLIRLNSFKYLQWMENWDIVGSWYCISCVQFNLWRVLNLLNANVYTISWHSTLRCFPNPYFLTTNCKWIYWNTSIKYLRLCKLCTNNTQNTN